MPRILIVFVGCCAWGISQAQDVTDKWKSLVDIDQNRGDYFLVDRQDLTDDFQIVKRLDENNFIVSAHNPQNLVGNQFRSVKNDWKLNIARTQNPSSKSAFYVKTIGEYDFSTYAIEVIKKYHNSYLILTSCNKIHTQLKHDPNIIHISDEGSRPTVESRVLDMNLNPNRINKIHHFYPDLNGSGELISIQENQFIVEDIDLRGRSVEASVKSEIIDNHATEMATIIAGAGNSFITGRGVADRASITSSDFAEVLPDSDADYQSLGITTQNHSYGTQIENFYGVQAQAFDESAFNNPNLIHIFSSGNQGLETGTEGTYSGITGFANLTGNFKMAKNVLVVGSVDTVNNEVPFASRGPAYDGRVKPELVAYSMVGSSNSAALTSGVSSLFQQEYKAAYGTEMSSALLKALLINGANDVGSSGLDFVTGYGSMDAYKSLQLLKDGQFFSGAASNGSSQDFPINIPANAISLKVTLVWTDPPSDINSFKALLNDLDLKLVDASMTETLPWVLNTEAVASSLSASATRGIDRLNNVEQVTIDSPTGTNYMINVSGFDVSGSQAFYLVYSYELNESFEWDYPVGSDNMPYNGETDSYFRWKSTLTASHGVLEYSVDAGVNWIILDENVDLSLGYWRWSDIPLLNTDAIARIRTDSESYQTNRFSISGPPEISVGFVCADSVRLQWESLDEVASYDVYFLGSEQLEYLTTTSDTALVLTEVSSSFTESNFSVVPKLADGKELISTLTIDYTQQAIECFVFSFFQDVVLDTGIYLDLRLGTTYGVERLTFQRREGGGFTTVDQIVDLNGPNVRVLDDHPVQGNNTHQVLIDFVNGEQIIQEASNTFYLTETPLIIFPNPVGSQGFVRIVTREMESGSPLFKLYDAKGAQLLRYQLLTTDDTIPTGGLQPGVYFYRLEDLRETFSGRLIVIP